MSPRRPSRLSWALTAAAMLGSLAMVWQTHRVPVLAPNARVERWALVPVFPDGTTTAQPSAGRVVVPRSGQVPTIPVQLGESTLDFVVDTGAERNVLRQGRMRQAGLPSHAPGPIQTIRGVNTTAQAVSVALEELSVGGRSWPNQPFLVLDAEPLFELLAPSASGILGRPFLGHQVLRIEPERLLLASPDAAASLLADLDALPTVLDSKGARIPVTLDGVELTAWVDTGAQSSSLSRQAAELVGMRGPIRSGSGQLGAAGGTMDLVEADFGALNIGANRIDRPSLQVGHADEGVQLRLGMDLLGQLDAFALDYGQGRFYVPPPRGG